MGVIVIIIFIIMKQPLASGAHYYKWAPLANGACWRRLQAALTERRLRAALVGAACKRRSLSAATIIIVSITISDSSNSRGALANAPIKGRLQAPLGAPSAACKRRSLGHQCGPRRRHRSEDPHRRGQTVGPPTNGRRLQSAPRLRSAGALTMGRPQTPLISNSNNNSSSSSSSSSSRTMRSSK